MQDRPDDRVYPEAPLGPAVSRAAERDARPSPPDLPGPLPPWVEAEAAQPAERLEATELPEIAPAPLEPPPEPGPVVAGDPDAWDLEPDVEPTWPDPLADEDEDVLSMWGAEDLGVVHGLGWDTETDIDTEPPADAGSDDVVAGPLPDQSPRAEEGPQGEVDAAFLRVAERLERIAETLRERSRHPGGAPYGGDPLEILITGYALGFAEARRRDAEREAGDGGEG